MLLCDFSWHRHPYAHFPCILMHLKLSKGHLLQVEWAKLWPDEWSIACPPPEEPAEVEVVFDWHLVTAVHKSLPHACF